VTTSNHQRLSKFLAHQGFGSRRSVEKLIAEGQITVNGEVNKQQGTKIDPNTDVVHVNGNVVKPASTHVYYWLNKPKGVTSSRTSQAGETTVIDLVPKTHRVYPVGRLDKDSRGLILLTNDGLLTHRLTHPKFHIPKTYVVLVYGTASQKQLQHLQRGIELEEGMTKPSKWSIISTSMAQEQTRISSPQPNRSTWLKVTLHEGKHRQIRRMTQAVNLHVLELVRVKFGPISLTNLAEKTWSPAKPGEITSLKELVGLSYAHDQTT
jgi:23S rRNA pseudouridine2605 synthase